MGIPERWHIEIRGTVQGVGFRPFVYRIASEMGLSGFVRNTPQGVTIEAQGAPSLLDEFIKRIDDEQPPLSRIRQLSHHPIEAAQGTSFVIETSERHSENLIPAISPDIATCDDCLKELFSPKDRRHTYPFTNCTNCGPRYTIIESLPYDRPKTSMKNFKMCAECSAEYNYPLDRRFHAQPNACPKCGPKLQFQVACSKLQEDDSPVPFNLELGTWNLEQYESSPLECTIALLRSGNIVAIKGLGGFHLTCDATNDEAVRRLRERKMRDEKPFAIMVRDLAAASEICKISCDEAKLLESPERPIVLLRKRDDIPIAESVAPNNKCLGVMLPYTPLHHLLFTSYESTVLVMTSANISDEPLVSDNEEAQTQLSAIADAYLTHDRPIHMRIDDSVVRPAHDGFILMRRARGFVPSSIELPIDAPKILALGGDIKNAFCLTNGRNAYLSQHIGDLENAKTHAHFERAIDHLKNILRIEPEIVACDMHPNYFSTRFASNLIPRGCSKNARCKASRPRSAESYLVGTSQAGRGSATQQMAFFQQPIMIQHHHAHIASCMAEHGLPNEMVIGIALDGAGYGADGTIWGGEILRANYKVFERIASLKPIAQPGGDIAAREPWRMALAYLSSEHFGQIPAFKKIAKSEIDLVIQVIEKKLNSPLTTSCGRLFDAVAAITGLALYNSFEGQAAMMLEQAADENVEDAYLFGIIKGSDRWLVDPAVMFSELISDIHRSLPVSIIGAKFHNGLAFALAKTVSILGGSEPVVLSGGCMQNTLLLKRLVNSLEEDGRKVYTHRLVPPNDGGLALGQATVAGWRVTKN